MAMSVGNQEEGGAIASINTTPLVDVMLVLLIIFLITIPVINKTVKVDLPKAVNIPTQTKPENITIAVDKAGNIYWNDKQVRDRDELLGLVKTAAVKKPQPEIHIRGDKDAALRGHRPGHVRHPARRHREGRLHHRARPRRARLSARSPGDYNGNECWYEFGEGDVRYQHDAADRRHAGAAGHADRVAADHDPRGEAGHAATRAIRRRRRRCSPK